MSFYFLFLCAREQLDLWAMLMSEFIFDTSDSCARESRDSGKYLYIYIQSNSIHNSLKAEATQMATKGQTDT